MNATVVTDLSKMWMLTHKQSGRKLYCDTKPIMVGGGAPFHPDGWNTDMWELTAPKQTHKCIECDTELLFECVVCSANNYQEKKPCPVEGINPDWVIGYLDSKPDPEVEEAIRNAFEEYAQMNGSNPPTEGFVQRVPDKCDRIVWRGDYYHLPINVVSNLREVIAGWDKEAEGRQLEQGYSRGVKFAFAKCARDLEGAIGGP